jgi:hypothetical protein
MGRQKRDRRAEPGIFQIVLTVSLPVCKQKNMYNCMERWNTEFILCLELYSFYPWHTMIGM